MKSELIAVLVALGALLGAAVPALADGGGGGGEKNAGMPIRWKATSPAIHEGDRYSLVVKNTSEENQRVRIHTIIMDHVNDIKEDAVNEQVELAPGEEREFAAVNGYGDANHFNTLIGSETQDLAMSVSIADPGGTETARFTEKAFLLLDEKKGNKAAGHGHKGLAASVPAVLGDTALLAPLPLGILAATRFGLYAFRRRWTSAGSATGRLVGTVALPPVWKAAAVGGLALSAVLHVGLAPAHFEEAVVQGVFFFVAGAIAAIIAAAVLAWPSRLAYLTGAGISLALILLWAAFLLVPPPGSETKEAVDLAGLFTKATELVTAMACAVLWFRARRTHQPDRAKP